VKSISPSRRVIALVIAAATCSPVAAAHASTLLQFNHGRVHIVDDPTLPANTDIAPGAHATASDRRPAATVAGYAENARAVGRALARAHAAKLITDGQYTSYAAGYANAVKTRATLSGRCKSQLDYVIYTIERMARAGRLNATRLPSLFAQLAKNVQFWSAKPAPRIGNGDRVRFRYGPIYQHYPGMGLQLQPLGTFGKAGAIADACLKQGLKAHDCATTSLRRMLDGMVHMTSRRGRGKGFATWEYWFDWEGGQPGWASGMAQATAIQAFARAAKVLNRPNYLTVAHDALGIFETPAPIGARAVGKGGGPDYLIYTFAPKLRVANAFSQAVLGLFDYAALTRDPLGFKLYHEGERTLRREISESDAGDWSYYSYPKGPKSNLSYHLLLAGFLSDLCARTHVHVFCHLAAKYFREARGEGGGGGGGGGSGPARQTCGVT
jgi:hypothetical protein